MITIRLGGTRPESAQGCVAVPVPAAQGDAPVAIDSGLLPDDIAAEAAAYLAETEHKGSAGSVQSLPRPLRQPARLLLVGVGAGDEAGWRTAGAALARAAAREARLTVLAPADLDAAALRGLAEGLWLASYRFSMTEPKADAVPKLAEVVVAVEDSQERETALAAARTVADLTRFARDLTNTPSQLKTPAWFVEQVLARTGDDVTARVREQDQLAAEGFGGILAVGGGSAQPPRLLELSWAPEGATRHVVLVGKGITFDTGGIDIKPTEAMQLMRKDMGAAATVCATVLAAAELDLPVRITALAPLAENMVSGSSWRSGDVVTHYGGLTSEVHSTDAEGRVVLADAMAYAVAHLQPDLLLDLATLTGASRVALGKKTAAVFSDNEELLAGVGAAAAQAGELVWRMPLADEYVKDVAAEIADLNNAAGNPGAITAALYLREFAGPLRDRWLHVDMSAPAWSGGNDAELVKGATGWGVRTLVRWLSALN
ncbi:leucyl aminopeptidase family protein [Catellatospora sp. KI3]|uniref:leucyl aminopeptidase family protein n=1 Tax=Catellatospora sp. KI3 TaxID=3041620 RepID=UPI0024827773|nr:leucyl aminopeptidase family protein [Catellatospora sp. KI3]MDI1460165.1 leucyl aminopeptidase family protein [Catellatospora sp. KI3]